MEYSKCQQCDDKYPECEKTCTEYLEHVARCKEIEKNRREYYKEHSRMMKYLLSDTQTRRSRR